MSEEEPSIEQVDETPKTMVLGILKEPFHEKEESLFERIVTLMGSIEGNEIPAMRNVDRKRLSGANAKVDAMFKGIVK